MFETSKHVPKTEKRCCVFKDNHFICANKTIYLYLFNVSSRVNKVFRFIRNNLL